MSAAAASGAEVAAAPAKGKKKLIIIIAAVLLLAGLGGGGALFMMKKKAAEAAAAAEAEGEDGSPAAHKKAAHKEAGAPPAFLPLEPFVVNLADKETDRYAQIGITLEIDDPKTAEQLKAYMPAIRNGVLMVLAHKTSAELLERKGKEALAAEIMRETVRPLGIELEEPEAEAADEDEDKPKKKRKKKAPVDNPVKHVHFSNFIIQ
ncbi:flagellar basal body-associated FliL family protein [Variovorax sp. YR752]|uniref:flagellar basal body-associated FliL family protein n=1 Tax=Variovorax sp. YR752 TaxID=1884383 RepID=UPI003137E0A8